MHTSFLGTWELPCRDSLDLQKSLHINAKVQVESRVTSDSQRKKKSGGGSFQGHAHNTRDPWAGWTLFGLVTVANRCLGRCHLPGRAGQTCVLSDQGQPLDDTARRKLGQTFQMGKISWQTCRFQKEARTTILSSNVPNSLSPTLEPDHPEQR